MPARLFLAGATGAIGARLAPLLLAAGYEVFGTTRSEPRARSLEAAGVKPVVVDVFDAAALLQAMRAVRPQIVVHQLTDLPRGVDPSGFPERIEANARVRSEGTRNLVAAAIECGARRVVAQSIAWAYAPGPEPHSEDDPLDLRAEGLRAVTVRGVVALERLTLGSPPIAGVVLRYGRLYGPGTGKEALPDSVPLHVDAAASAALLAARYAGSGVFNIIETDDYASTEKARRQLGWSPEPRGAVALKS